MRSAAVLCALMLAAGALLFSGLDARSGTLPGLHVPADGSLAGLIVKVGKDKAQTKLNKSCGQGKVFVEDKGCMDRDRAVKKKQKDKEKAKQNTKPASPPPPPPPPPPKKMFCKTFPKGVGGALSCAGGNEVCKILANGDTECCCPE